MTAFALAGNKFLDDKGNKLEGKALRDAHKAVTEDWIRRHPKFAASLEGKDYKSEYERVRRSMWFSGIDILRCWLQVRTRVGFQKAKIYIKQKARAASVLAHRFKFLWG